MGGYSKFCLEFWMLRRRIIGRLRPLLLPVHFWTRLNFRYFWPAWLFLDLTYSHYVGLADTHDFKATHVLYGTWQYVLYKSFCYSIFVDVSCNGIAYLFIRYVDDTCIKNHGDGKKNLQILNAGLSAACSIEWPSNFYAYLFLFPLVI